MEVSGDAACMSGGGSVPGWSDEVSAGIDPMRRGPASLERSPSLLSQQPKRLYRD